MRPKLKENAWRIDREAESAILFTAGQAYEIPFAPAQVFMTIRPFCTGHHTRAEIAERSGVSEEDVNALLRSLGASGMIYDGADICISPSPDEVVAACKSVVGLWAQELGANYIGNEISRGNLSKATLIGWLVEMYHYIKDFPESLKVAAASAAPPLKGILEKYYLEETGHEKFVLLTLRRLGLSKEEVEASSPLLATSLISMLMKDLFKFEPISVFLVAALIEAQEFDEKAIIDFTKIISENYGIDAAALKPYFDHQRIDVELGHAELLNQHGQWIKRIDPSKMDRIINAIHDIKHAFELQSMEIKAYYNSLDGRYFPRQPMKFADIL